MPIDIRGLAPLLEVFDMPTAIPQRLPDGWSLAFIGDVSGQEPVRKVEDLDPKPWPGYP